MPPLSLVGTLPLSSINTGLSASVGGLTAEATKLGAEITDLTPALQAQIQVSADFPPNLASYTAVIGAALSPAELGAVMTPGNMTAISADANAGLVAKLGFVEAQIAAAGAVRGAIAGGLEAGSITGWSYSGRCNGFGPTLERHTALGFGELGPSEQVSGVVIVTQSLTSWQQFAKSMSADPATAGATPTDTRLTPHGARSASRWDVGVSAALARLDGFIAELEGMKANIQAAIRVSTGLDLPSASVVVDAGLDVVGSVGIDGLLDNLVNVQTDVDGAIGVVQGKLDATLSLSAEIGGQLSAGGFTVWTYSGRADGFGKAVTAALAHGLPSGAGPGAVVYGLALAGSGPSMSTFGSIFLTS